MKVQQATWEEILMSLWTRGKTPEKILFVATVLSGITSIGLIFSNLGLYAAIAGGVCLGLIGSALYYIPQLRDVDREKQEAYSLLDGIRGVMGGVKCQESPDSFVVHSRLPGGGAMPQYSVYHIDRAAASTERYDLNWITFLSGCEKLYRWLPGRVAPNLYVGINACGVIVANYIRTRREDDDKPFASYMTITQQPKKPGQLRGLPSGKKFKKGPVLLVDSRIKTGATSSAAAKAIRIELGQDVELWFVCLLACGITPEGVDAARIKARVGNGPIPIESLFEPEVNYFFGDDDDPLEFFPHGIAYVGPGVIGMPSGLR